MITDQPRDSVAKQTKKAQALIPPFLVIPHYEKFSDISGPIDQMWQPEPDQTISQALRLQCSQRSRRWRVLPRVRRSSQSLSDPRRQQLRGLRCKRLISTSPNAAQQHRPQRGLQLPGPDHQERLQLYRPNRSHWIRLYHYQWHREAKIAGIVLPALLGTSSYEVVGDSSGGLCQAFDTPVATIQPATPLTFGSPVSCFGVRGIQLASNIDPANTTAFVTGILFDTPSGTVSLSQIPITRSTDVPAPLPLLGGLAALGLRLRLGRPRARSVAS